ncbi:NeuD/PglB/VioB family sugar acetyltransferase [Allomuricauda sp. SCSIO 65647]|uniref:NeuD/PglB/VioB family sugar acetyltransferase n=1 Tax=Allomuricauda sp. SCSIO 65647 TaxID=2908843 RepID=UPI001F004576|nr:NeuD/PglB/VioB family sugar acetyltransferase [Muricauda sp. SCSIO 65647]UJH67010.1 NeuD/PglB/VioB family sugar acetyltransferase [Muricauda sp. SCSIO 65647]
MKNRLFIIGAGGFGRQLESYLELLPSQKKDWELKGYIDDNPNALDGKGSDYEVLGNIDDFGFKKDDFALVAIADIDAKIKIVETLRGKVKFFTLVAVGTLIGKNVTLGEGTIICPGAKIGSNVTIGEFGLVNLDTIVGHDSVIGKNCSIMPHVDIGGGTNIGDNIFMGTKATVSPRLTVVNDTHLGVGAVVIKNIVESGTYFGNPARRML